MVKVASIEQFLKLQSSVPAVDRFSSAHDEAAFDKGQKTYKELIPKTNPGPGQQYAFEVDLDACSGCKACVVACHNENGLDPDETWRSVGLIQGGTSQNPSIQHVTTACHHCVDPACLNGCPTKAYTKDPVTGVVKHLDDQCFGCQYCILKCPYDVPKYNSKRGIVHKCDMCIGRLNAGEAPACVRSCPNEAIAIKIVNKADAVKNPSDYVKVPDAPASDYTFPTTKYKTKRQFPDDMESLDYQDLKPEHSHFPLVVMLTLTQLSVGAFLADVALKKFFNLASQNLYSLFHVPFALGVGLLALAASLFHLGRPHLAFRAFLGVRTSWLSREILAFGLFAKAAIVYAVCHWWLPLRSFLEQISFGLNPITILEYTVVGAGVLGVFCSVMVYRDTKRPFWDNSMTTFKFFLTGSILGVSTLLLTSTLIAVFHPMTSLSEMMNDYGYRLLLMIAVSLALKFIFEAGIFLELFKKERTFLGKTALLMTQPLEKFTIWRFGIGFWGGLLIPFLLTQVDPFKHVALSTFMIILVFGFCLAGEILERYLFFKAVVPLKMPGNN